MDKEEDTVSAPVATLRRLVWMNALLPGSLFMLAGCSEGAPTSPALDVEESSLAQGTRRGKIAIKVGNHVKLLSNGNLEVKVRAICPRGYVREESGLLRVEQGLASGEGSVQLQLGGCTGRWQSGTTTVFSFSEPEAPFRRGPARVLVTFAVVNPDDPTGADRLQASVDQTVRIR
jgi:hypothetical protein